MQPRGRQGDALLRRASYLNLQAASCQVRRASIAHERVPRLGFLAPRPALHRFSSIPPGLPTACCHTSPVPSCVLGLSHSDAARAIPSPLSQRLPRNRCAVSVHRRSRLVERSASACPLSHRALRRWGGGSSSCGTRERGGGSHGRQGGHVSRRSAPRGLKGSTGSRYALLGCYGAEDFANRADLA